ncbi:MAG TPA: hypothetical protein VL633_10960 [Bacteroidota bacterium]|nr:hypothetical protein [Bacteroidota bacterium]
MLVFNVCHVQWPLKGKRCNHKQDTGTDGYSHKHEPALSSLPFVVPAGIRRRFFGGKEGTSASMFRTSR